MWGFTAGMNELRGLTRVLDRVYPQSLAIWLGAEVIAPETSQPLIIPSETAETRIHVVPRVTSSSKKCFDLSALK